MFARSITCKSGRLCHHAWRGHCACTESPAPHQAMPPAQQPALHSPLQRPARAGRWPAWQSVTRVTYCNTKEPLPCSQVPLIAFLAIGSIQAQITEHTQLLVTARQHLLGSVTSGQALTSRNGHIDSTSGMLSGTAKDGTTHLEAVQEIVREDEPGAPDAQHAQDIAPEGLLRHAAVDRAVCLLHITPRLSLRVQIQIALQCRSQHVAGCQCCDQAQLARLR